MTATNDGEKGRFRLLHPVTLTRTEFNALRAAADGKDLLETEYAELRGIVHRAEVRRQSPVLVDA